MKKILYLIGLSLIGNIVNAQILTNSVPAAGVSQSNAFLDASTSYSSAAGENNNKHKGLVFPDVNLTTFQFENVIANGATFPTYYNGMVVYNTATGNTLTTGNNPSTSTAVTPGFYYFSNPSGATNSNVTGGTWKTLGASTVINNVFSVTTATYTALATDGTLLVNVPSGGATVTLPAASTNSGKILIIKKIDDDADVLTFSTAVKVTATDSFTTLNYPTTIRIQSDGANWWLIN